MTGVVLLSLTLVARKVPGQPFAARGFLGAVRGLVLPLPGRSIQVILLAFFVALQKPSSSIFFPPAFWERIEGDVISL